ncbi:unnamed protein product [Mytilus coruscus]|uniref:Uncharacterized protein n=1 Tax=Mytilus coruscus TaxID=42192 RepID=A0A6J8BY01_MYTCO|nr:unnamed protein product [Mytilus coruscus]
MAAEMLWIILLACVIDIKSVIAYSFPSDQAYHTERKTWKVASERCGNNGLEFDEKVLKNIPIQQDNEVWIGKNIYRLNTSWIEILGGGRHIGPCVIKFHAVDEQSFLSCTGGQQYIMYNGKYGHNKKIDSIATMDSPTDISSDDNSHIYVSGQGSNNIHRLEGYIEESLLEPETTVWKVLDIPLDAHHGIKEPVALCFNQAYSKLYIVNE